MIHNSSLGTGGDREGAPANEACYTTCMRIRRMVTFPATSMPDRGGKRPPS